MNIFSISKVDIERLETLKALRTLEEQDPNGSKVYIDDLNISIKALEKKVV